MITRSRFELRGIRAPLPRFAGTRVLLMPIIHGDRTSLPDELAAYGPLVEDFAKAAPAYHGQVVYLTIDEKFVRAGQTHRRRGLHVDGFYLTEEGGRRSGTWGGGGGAWGGASVLGDGGTGLLTVSDVAGCRAWGQEFAGVPAPEGDCEHFRPQCRLDRQETLAPGGIYWLGPLCVHESLPMEKDTRRTFVRLSLPSKAEWYEGCTPNPRGVLPTGPVAPRRRFMSTGRPSP